LVQTLDFSLALDECREDLKRDEMIFADKVKELKKCRKLISTLTDENAALKRKLDELSSSPQKFFNDCVPSTKAMSVSQVGTPSTVAVGISKGLHSVQGEQEVLEQSGAQTEHETATINSMALQNVDQQLLSHNGLQVTANVEESITQKEKDGEPTLQVIHTGGSTLSLTREVNDSCQKELSDLREKYSRLTNQMEEAENAQRERIEELRKQVTERIYFYCGNVC
jgi:hypothetical protein